jgi:uncharacterized protein YbjT (DUF2867 family)
LRAPTGSSRYRTFTRAATKARFGRERRSRTRRRRRAACRLQLGRKRSPGDGGIPHFDSKWEIEEYKRQTDLPYTILRPVFFMQNWEMMRDQILDGPLAQPLDPEKPLQQVNVEDLGVFAIAFLSRNFPARVGGGAQCRSDSRTAVARGPS